MNLKTKEGILNDVSSDTTTKGRVKWLDAEKAMQEYADQSIEVYKAKLKDGINELARNGATFMTTPKFSVPFKKR